MCTSHAIQIEEFAASLEQSFMQVGKKLQGFKNQIKDIKQTSGIQPKNTRCRNRVFKGVSRPKKKVVKKELTAAAVEVEQETLKE